MHVKDMMSRLVDSIRSDQPIAEAARLMKERDHGVLPVLVEGRLGGIVTDRDLVVRAMAEGLSSATAVGDVMTDEVYCCYPVDDVDDALRIMADEQIRRLPVCDSSGRLLGMVSLADAARHAHRSKDVALALADMCAPMGDHCQSVAAMA